MTLARTPSHAVVTFDGVFPVGHGDRGFEQLHGLLEQQGIGHVVGHDACERAKRDTTVRKFSIRL